MKRLAISLLVGLSMVVIAVALRAQSTADKQPQSAIALPNLPSNSKVQVQLDTAGAGPRQIEDTTEKAIVRDYANAWSVMATALENNSAGALASGFTGTAQQRLAERIREQQKSGLRTRFVDHGHKLQAIFYSPEGSAMQLRDTANVEEQILDGNAVVASKQTTVSYVTLMTVGEERWKVRLLQATDSK